MTLDKIQTAMLEAAMGCRGQFFYWLEHDIPNISNNEYANIKYAFESWKMRMRMKGFMAQSLTILLLLSVVSLNFLSLLHDKHMMLQQLSPTDFHTIDADL